MEKQLKEYCDDKLLQYEIEDGLFHFQDKVYEIVDRDEILFDEDFEFLPDLKEDITDGFVYEFGGRFYLQEAEEETSLDELINKGKANQKIPTESFIGVHSGMEILNGVGLYEAWIKKAKFLGIKNLGIVEKNTLAGVINFQSQCKYAGIKPIIGLTVSVKNEFQEYEIKAYAKDFQGWQNLLIYSSEINLEKKIAVDESILLENNEGVIFILDPKTLKFENKPKLTSYYLCDTVKFENFDLDSDYLENLAKYLQSDLQPVGSYDAYYCEQEEWEVREKLWGVAKAFDFKTKNQFFKSNDQYAKELIQLFEDGNRSWVQLFKDGAKNLAEIVEQCNFKYDVTSRHLPAYKMTEEESSQFKSNEELFMHLIKKGFTDRKITDAQKYIDRLKEEIYVLRTGNVIDYFLILHDINNFARQNDILVGIGRGSAGGSLVSYLLGIIQIDPLEFDLIFARFLNVGRMGAMTKCDAYEIETTEGTIKLNELSALTVLRDGKELPIMVEELKEGDKILKY